MVTFTKDGVTYTYLYNEKGQRICKYSSAGTTKYVYDGDKLITEINSTYRLDFLYDENGQLFALVKDNQTKYFYVRDIFNNILGLTDETGDIVDYYDYTAYGECTFEPSSVIGTQNPFRYKGYYFDQESGMYYCHTRYYVPEWCRWLNADHPAYLERVDGTIQNLFAYCGNEPITKLDIYGADWTFFWNQIAQEWNFRWNRFVNNIKSFGWKLLDTLQVVADSFVFEVGIGGGFGAEVQAGSFSASLISRTDFFSFKGDQESMTSPFGMRQVASFGIAWHMLGYSYDFRDYYESYDGKKSDNSNKGNAFFGIGASLYFGIGANFSVGFDLDNLQKINAIWGY